MNKETQCPVSQSQIEPNLSDSHFNTSNDLMRPPQVPGRLILRNTLDIFNRPLDFFQEMHEQYGEIFQIRSITNRYIIIAGADANRFMTGEGKHYFSSEKTWGKALHKLQLIISMDGDIHKEQRDYLKPVISKSKFKSSLGLIAQSVESTLNKYTEGVHEAGPFMRHIVSHELGDAMLDPKIPKPNRLEIERIIFVTNAFLGVSILGKPWLTLMSPKVLLSAITTIKFSLSHRKNIIASEKAGTLSDFAQHLLAEPEKNSSGWHNKLVGLGYTALPFFAGLDTLGATMTYAMYELIKNPEIQERVRKEVDEYFNPDLITLEQLDGLQNLMGFVYETMRLHPIGFGMNRVATQDFSFKGYAIKKGERVIIFTASNHLNEEYFKNPTQFDIDRYREPRKEHRKDGVFAPFGKGPHTCPAAGISEVLLAINLAVILKKFKISEAIDLNKVVTVATPAPALSDNFTIKLLSRSD